MDAKDHKVEAVLGQAQQWVIPVYQRHYAWETGEDKQIPNLWNDMEARANEQLETGKVSPHFFGAMIYSEPSERAFSTTVRRFLVDGQQRITTFNIALCALREVSKYHALDQFTAETDTFVFNTVNNAMAEPERDRFKLWSSSTDRPYYLTLADHGVQGLQEKFPEYFYKNGKLIYGQAPKIISAYCYLVEKISDYLSAHIEAGGQALDALSAIRHGFLYGFQIVVVQLGEQDDAQSIFASLNGNAQPLSAFDLIRNDIFHRARKGEEDEEALYSGPWARLESMFWKTSVKQGRRKLPRTDHLIAHTLVAELAHDINVGHVANEYSTYAKKQGFETVEQEIHSLLKYADVYQHLEEIPADCPEARIAELVKTWDISTFHPLIMWIGNQKYDEATKCSAYRLLENYIVRRELCNLTAKNYNRVVPTLLSKIKQSADPLQALTDAFSDMSGDGSRMPNNTEVSLSAETIPVYSNLTSRKLKFIFRCVELSMRSKNEETVSLDNITVEHIMPKAWPRHWPLPDGVQCPDDISNLLDLQENGLSIESVGYARKRNSLIHTIGNLTLATTSLNPSMGNDGWKKKRAKLSRSLLSLNREIADSELWDENTIVTRSKQLGQRLNILWPPALQ